MYVFVSKVPPANPVISIRWHFVRDYLNYIQYLTNHLSSENYLFKYFADNLLCSNNERMLVAYIYVWLSP